jgi:hypothetical protein
MVESKRWKNKRMVKRTYKSDCRQRWNKIGKENVREVILRMDTSSRN